MLTWVFSLFQGLSSGRHGTATSGAKWVTVAILVYVNLINYMDRLTIAGRSQAVSNLFLPQSLTAVISSSLQSLLSSISFLNIFCYNIFLPPFSISSISSCHDLFLHDVFLPPISSCLRSLPASDIFLHQSLHVSNLFLPQSLHASISSWLQSFSAFIFSCLDLFLPKISF